MFAKKRETVSEFFKNVINIFTSILIGITDDFVIDNMINNCKAYWNLRNDTRYILFYLSIFI